MHVTVTQRTHTHTLSHSHTWAMSMRTPRKWIFVTHFRFSCLDNCAFEEWKRLECMKKLEIGVSTERRSQVLRIGNGVVRALCARDVIHRINKRNGNENKNEWQLCRLIHCCRCFSFCWMNRIICVPFRSIRYLVPIYMFCAALMLPSSSRFLCLRLPSSFSAWCFTSLPPRAFIYPVHSHCDVYAECTDGGWYRTASVAFVTDGVNEESQCASITSNVFVCWCVRRWKETKKMKTIRDSKICRRKSEKG